ncbi:ABC transporter permease subunit [Arsenicitalea aurantiaca]|uniref:ABC transporter permease subunit n=1 Tax=Arsenicitalea aurantiaca TaxID=1783274 RepID=A0A433XET7_9HYPH|nr:ABC transporter permease subunit [Arsenicitalea aurantiaca]RUT32603.1 ABC transporter permease subunit [Arsenicitalea aurantiaca]
MTDNSAQLRGAPQRHDDTRTQPKTSILNDPRFRGFAYQAMLLAALVALVWWLASNAAANLAAQNKATGFGFLGQPAGFNISFTLIPFERAASYLQVYFVGITNTLLVASIGVVLATVIGFVVGIARLSSNFLIRKFATVYIEILRNVPLLLQLLFWYYLLLNALPNVRQSYTFPGGFVLNQRGFSMPAAVFDDRSWIVGLVLLASVILALLWRRHTLKRTVETGNRRPVWLPMAAIVLVPTLAALLLSGTQITFNVPELQGFNYRGGFTAPPELTALIVGLVMYTAAFIAEIVRAGILSVSHGQTEAAASLGLQEGDRLRLVIIPQAMRVIVPPLTSQYLNLTKNSSLGAAIGFPELVSVFVGTALNQSGRAIEIIGLTMLVYLTFSLTTSLFMNWYNARVALVER